MHGEPSEKYHHGDLRTCLIKATVDMINREGVDAVTMRKLSDRLGVSRTAAYRHFSNKTDLLTETAIEGFKQLNFALRVARLDYYEDEIGRFRLMGEAYVEFALEHPAYYGLMFSSVSIEKTDVFNDACRAAYSELVEILITLQKAKKIKKEAADIQAKFVWSIIHGYSSLVINGKLHDTTNLSEEMAVLGQKIMVSLI